MKKALVLILIAVLAVITLTSCNQNFTLTYEDSEKYSTGGAEISELPSSLEIEWVSGSVEISYHDKPTVEFYEESSRNTEEREKMRYYPDGATLRIKYAKSGVFSIKNLTKKLYVKLPVGFAADKAEISAVSADIEINALSALDAELESVSGRVRISDSSFNDLKLDTVSGDIELSAVGVSDELEIDSVSASVRATLNAALGELDASTISGDFTLSVTALNYFDVETTSGTVELSLPTQFISGQLDSVSGNCILKLDAAASFTLEFDTVSGSFNSELATTSKDGRYVAGTGEGRLEADTASGNLKIYKIN